jgi:hypothetical protein
LKVSEATTFSVNRFTFHEFGFQLSVGRLESAFDRDRSNFGGKSLVAGI